MRASRSLEEKETRRAIAWGIFVGLWAFALSQAALAAIVVIAVYLVGRLA